MEVVSDYLIYLCYRLEITTINCVISRKEKKLAPIVRDSHQSNGAKGILQLAVKMKQDGAICQRKQ